MDLFEKIASISDNKLSETQIKEVVARIVSILKEYHITYDQAFKILQVTNRTLTEMSTAIEL